MQQPHQIEQSNIFLHCHLGLSAQSHLHDASINQKNAERLLCLSLQVHIKCKGNVSQLPTPRAHRKFNIYHRKTTEEKDFVLIDAKRSEMICKMEN